MRTNGLEAPGYVAVVDVHPLLADALLEILAAEGVAAYAAPVMRERRLSLRQDEPSGPTERLWVDRSQTVRAREILRARMPALRAELEESYTERPGRGDAASTDGSAAAAPKSPAPDTAAADEDTTETDRDGAAGVAGRRAGEVPALTGAGGATTGGRALPDVVDDELWAQIVASIEGSAPETLTDAPAETDEASDPGHPWPASEDLDVPAAPAGRPAPTWDFTGGRTSRADVDVDGTADDAREADEWTAPRQPRSTAPLEDNDHFVPPPPPPLPEGDRTLRLAWGGVIGGPLLFLLAVIFQWELSSWAQLAGVAALVGGFITLVTRMRDDDDPNDPDHGAAL